MLTHFVNNTILPKQHTLALTIYALLILSLFPVDELEGDQR